MPIEIAASISVVDQESFHAIDKIVTGFAFEIHNEFGRYLDERLYQAELAAYLAHKFQVHRELKMTLKFGAFRKEYHADFLLNCGVIVEVKTAEVLTKVHQGQVLNYLYLCGLRHATLLNLRPERVQHQFVSTNLTLEQRRIIIFDKADWMPLSAGCQILKTVLEDALLDWGSRLELSAYRDVVVYFLGGEAAVEREVEVHSQHGVLGHQKMWLLSDEIGFSITASIHNPRAVWEHQRRFLEHTQLRAMQWVNLNGQTVTFRTIYHS